MESNTAQLTIIIPFLNEGEEIANTVASIIDTAIGVPFIMLINDASTDGYDYRSVADKYNCLYILHSERMGVAKSRDEGVAKIETPYFLLLDGHMRFYEKGWDERLLLLLENNPRSVLCGQTRRLVRDDMGMVVNGEYKTCYGAYIDMGKVSVFKATWNYKDPNPYSTLSEIPCILGAAYACSKEYWQYLHGLEGLRFYGLDEELLSLKVWCEGGRCLLVKDWEVGHIYRKEFPYDVPNKEFVYNRILTIELFLPYKLKRELFSIIQRTCKDVFVEAFELLKVNYVDVKKEKDYLHSISKKDIQLFLERNDSGVS